MVPTGQRPLLKESWHHDNDNVVGETCWSYMKSTNVMESSVVVVVVVVVYSQIISVFYHFVIICGFVWDLDSSVFSTFVWLLDFWTLFEFSNFYSIDQ